MKSLVLALLLLGPIASASDTNVYKFKFAPKESKTTIKQQVLGPWRVETGLSFLAHNYAGVGAFASFARQFTPLWGAGVGLGVTSSGGYIVLQGEGVAYSDDIFIISGLAGAGLVSGNLTPIIGARASMEVLPTMNLALTTRWGSGLQIELGTLWTL